MKLTESQLRKVVRQELRKVMSEAIKPLTDVQNIKRLFHMYGMYSRFSVEDAFKPDLQDRIEGMLKSNEQIGGEYSESDIEQAARELTLDLGGEAKESPEGQNVAANRRRYSEEEIENPYGR